MPRHRKTPEYRDPYKHISTGNGDYASYHANSGACGRGLISMRGILKMEDVLGESPRARGRRILHSENLPSMPEIPGRCPGSYPWKTEPQNLQKNENMGTTRAQTQEYMYDQFGNPPNTYSHLFEAKGTSNPEPPYQNSKFLNHGVRQSQDMRNKNALTGDFWSSKLERQQFDLTESARCCISNIELGGPCDEGTWSRGGHHDYYGPQCLPDYPMQIRESYYPYSSQQKNTRPAPKRKKKKKAKVKEENENILKEVFVRRSRYCAICSVQYDCAVSEHNLDKVHMVKSELCKMGCALCFVDEFLSYDKLTSHMMEASHQQIVKLFKMKAKMIQEEALLETVTQEPSPTGEEHVRQISGFYCQLCREFIHPDKGDKTKHCQSKIHLALYNNYFKNQNSLEKSLADKIVKLSQKKTSDIGTDDLSESEVERKIKVLQRDLIGRNIAKDNDSQNTSDSKDNPLSLIESDLMKESNMDSDSVIESTIESDGNVSKSESSFSKKNEVLSGREKGNPELLISTLDPNKEIKSIKGSAVEEASEPGGSKVNLNMDVGEKTPNLRCPGTVNAELSEQVEKTTDLAIPSKETSTSAIPNKETDISLFPNKKTDISAIPNKETDISHSPNKETDISAFPNKEIDISHSPNKETDISAIPNKDNVSTMNSTVPQETSLSKTNLIKPTTPHSELQIESSVNEMTSSSQCIKGTIQRTKTDDIHCENKTITNTDTNYVTKDIPSTKDISLTCISRMEDSKNSKESKAPDKEINYSEKDMLSSVSNKDKSYPNKTNMKPVKSSDSKTVAIDSSYKEVDCKSQFPDNPKESSCKSKLSENLGKSAPVESGQEIETCEKGDLINPERSERKLVQADIDMLEAAIFDCNIKGSNVSICSKDTNTVYNVKSDQTVGEINKNFNDAFSKRLEADESESSDSMEELKVGDWAKEAMAEFD